MAGPVGWTLEGYTLDPEPCYEGQFAWFYRARRKEEDAARGWPLLVKRLHPWVTEDAGHAALFQADADAASRLAHPHLVRVLGFGSGGESCHLVMERLAGVRLSTALPRLLEVRGLLPSLLVARVGVALCSALGAVHAGGLLHLGVSPGNLLFTFGGGVKLLGLGTMKLEWQNHGHRGGLGHLTAAPFRYLSPEQVRARPLDARSDVFSLGLVLHELLTGAPLFARERSLDTLHAVLNAPIPRLAETRSDVPEALDRIVLRCLERDLDTRFPDVASVREALLGVLASTPTPPLEVQLPPLLWPLS